MIVVFFYLFISFCNVFSPAGFERSGVVIEKQNVFLQLSFLYDFIDFAEKY